MSRLISLPPLRPISVPGIPTCAATPGIILRPQVFVLNTSLGSVFADYRLYRNRDCVASNYVPENTYLRNQDHGQSQIFGNLETMFVNIQHPGERPAAHRPEITHESKVVSSSPEGYGLEGAQNVPYQKNL